MKIPIESITVEEESRIRQDPGDIASLENSIRKVGLLNPILVDENHRLVAGYRRLTACRNIGWTEIDVFVVRFEGDLLKLLEAEADENLLRKDFTPEEIESIEQRRQEILRKLRGNIWQRFWRWLKNIFRRKTLIGRVEFPTGDSSSSPPADDDRRLNRPGKPAR